MKRGAKVILLMLVTLLTLSATALADRGPTIPETDSTMMSTDLNSL